MYLEYLVKLQIINAIFTAGITRSILTRTKEYSLISSPKIMHNPITKKHLKKDSIIHPGNKTCARQIISWQTRASGTVDLHFFYLWVMFINGTCAPCKKSAVCEVTESGRGGKQIYTINFFFQDFKFPSKMFECPKWINKGKQY